MDKTDKKRGPNWDQEEKDILSKLVLEKLEYVENPKLDTNTNKRKKEAWNTIHIVYNLTAKTERTLDQLQNQWRKQKHFLKTKGSSFAIQTEDDPSSESHNSNSSIQKELLSIFTKYNEHDSNLSIVNELPPPPPELEDKDFTIKNEILDELLTSNDDIDVEEHTYYASHVENEQHIAPKRKTDFIDEEERSKRIKLLDLSILQKEAELKYAKIKFDTKIYLYEQDKKRLELQMKQMNEEHNMRIQKLNLELESLKANT